MTIRTEHNGAKNGGGHWGKREQAKRLSRKLRRRDGDRLIVEAIARKARVIDRILKAAR
jgi:hypothetical protein